MALIDKASLLMVPSTYEAGKLYNVLPSGNRAPDSTGENSGYDQTRADFDFDRGSNAAATRVNADGLIEKYRENLLTYSNDFEASDWTTNGATLISGKSGYDGTNDAFLLESTNTGSVSFLQQLDSNTGVLTFSIYARSGTTDFLFIKFASVDSGNTFFDLNSGSVVSTNGIDATIEDAGSGWYRCSITSNTSSHTRVRLYPAESGTSANSNIGDNIYIQSAQLESGMVATEYLESTSVTGKAGVLIDLPRIDYSSGAGALLLEPQRVNLYPYSEYTGSGALNGFGTGTYTQTITNNYSISPEGVKNAIRFQSTCGNTINDRSGLRDLLTLTTTNATLSFYAKSNTDSNQTITFHFAGGHRSIITTTPEWQRFDYTEVSPVTSVYCGLEIRGTITDTDVDVSVYGFQMEQASYPTSYIPNHGTSGGVTRAADSCSVTGASDVIGQTEGTLFIEFDHRYMASYPNEYIIDLEDSTHKLWIRKESAGNMLTSRLIVSGSNVWTISISATDGIAKIALAYKSGDSAVYYNGTQIGTSSATYTGSSFDDIYFNFAGTSNPELKAKQFVLFNERLTNEELATLTTL
jgi:hypothetical protein